MANQNMASSERDREGTHSSEEKKSKGGNVINSNFSSRAQSAISKISPRILDEVENISQQLQTRYADLRKTVTDTAMRVTSQTEKEMKAHPWKYLGGAVALGLVAGFLLSPKGKK